MTSVRYHFVLLCVVFSLITIPPASAQFKFKTESSSQQEQLSPFGPQRGESKKQTWRAGIVIEPGSQMEEVAVMIPIPMDWPEQTVLNIVDRKMDPAVSGKARLRTVNGGAQEMVLTLGRMRPHRAVDIVVDVELLNYELYPPNETDIYVIPKRIPRELNQYLKESPKIECIDHKRVFLEIFNRVTKDKPTDWEKVEAIYRFVQDNVKYNEAGKAKEAKGALALTRMPPGTWEGDCKDMCCLFVAICRVGKIPARLVRIPEHCYAEFYLELKDGVGPERGKGQRGFWFPCEVSGSYSFGGIAQREPILQKGDSFPDPDHRPRGKKLFLSECFEGSLAPDSPRPKFKWIHEIEGQ